MAQVAKPPSTLPTVLPGGPPDRLPPGGQGQFVVLHQEHRAPVAPRGAVSPIPEGGQRHTRCFLGLKKE